MMLLLRSVAVVVLCTGGALLALGVAPGEARAPFDAERYVRAGPGNVRLAVACAWETRGKANPDREVSPEGARGRCQVKGASAEVEGMRPQDVADLHRPLQNLFWAVAVDAGCIGRLARAGIVPFDLPVLHCYGTGRVERDVPTTRTVWWRGRLVVIASYAKQLGADVATARLRRHSAGLWWPERRN